MFSFKITEAQSKKEQSSIISDWSISGFDSSPKLSEPVKSMSLELDRIEMYSDSAGSNAAFLPRSQDKREVRAIFDLILNILESLRGSAKNDIRRRVN